MGKEVILFVDEIESSSEIPFCRICHDAEFESCKSLEAPCSCSGTVKFAHRDCIQRWCDEKGNTICEICLQNFEPGYNAPINKAQLPDAAVTIRGSLEVPRRERELELDEEQLLEYECSLAADRRANCCRFVALTLLIAKTSGIVLPMYILIRIIASIQNSIRRGYEGVEDQEMLISESEEDEEEHQFHRVEIQSS